MSEVVSEPKCICTAVMEFTSLISSRGPEAGDAVVTYMPFPKPFRKPNIAKRWVYPLGLPMCTKKYEPIMLPTLSMTSE